jgi:hypothetical protein
MESNLRERIFHLCEQAVVAGSENLEPIITELKEALHEHTEYLRSLAEEKLVPSLVSHEIRRAMEDIVRKDAA